MGLFDKVSDALSGGGSEESSENQTDREDDSGLGMFDPPKGYFDDRVDVGKRSDIIYEHYDVTEDQARVIAQKLKEELEDEDGYSLDSIRYDLEDELDIDDELLHTIVWTETSSINTIQRVSDYLQNGSHDDLYKLSSPLDDRTHPVTRSAVEEIESRGGGVPMKELAEILLEKAEEYEDEGGTPERMEHWVPHERFRFSITRYMDL